MPTALRSNNIEILDYLKSKNVTFTKPFYLSNRWDLKDGEHKKIKNSTLLWLWNNGYEWTKAIANECDNAFMKSFFD